MMYVAVQVRALVYYPPMRAVIIRHSLIERTHAAPHDRAALWRPLDCLTATAVAKTLWPKQRKRLLLTEAVTHAHANDQSGARLWPHKGSTQKLVLWQRVDQMSPAATEQFGSDDAWEGYDDLYSTSAGVATLLLDIEAADVSPK